METSWNIWVKEWFWWMYVCITSVMTATHHNYFKKEYIKQQEQHTNHEKRPSNTKQNNKERKKQKIIWGGRVKVNIVKTRDGYHLNVKFVFETNISKRDNMHRRWGRTVLQSAIINAIDLVFLSSRFCSLVLKSWYIPEKFILGWMWIKVTIDN